MSERLLGFVKKFNGKFGFITTKDGEDIFFHGGGITEGTEISVKDEVSFVKEKIPKEKRKKPDQKYQALEIELVKPSKEKVGEIGSNSSSKDTPKKSPGWSIAPLDDFSGQFVRVHGNDYRFHLKAGEPLPWLMVETNVPMTFSDAATGEQISCDTVGRLALTKSELILKVTMESLRGNLVFKSPRMADQVFVLEFK